MTLDHLWAGWRATYVESFGDAHGQPAPTSSPFSPRLAALTSGLDKEECVFCAILQADALSDEERLVVWRSGPVVAVLNAYPYASGHVLVMPVRHVCDLEGLSAEESAALWEGISRAVVAVKAAYGPEGLNLGLNLGRAAGAGIPGHLHVHIVPRWVGDTNFMTATASVRVLPEPLPDTYARLRAAWS